MPITGRTLAEAAQKFREHVNDVLNRTVTQTPLQLVQVKNGFLLAFRQGGVPLAAPLATRVGRMWLYMGQTCSSTIREGLHYLRTMRYAYTLTSDGSDEPLFRWEYVREPGDEAMWCRHHLQGPIPLFLNRQAASLNDLHLPTGYVPFEEILRFCIVDLQVEKLAANWDEILRYSYEQFKTEFVP